MDLADAMRVLAGAVIGEVVGLDAGAGPRAEAAYRDLFEQGERIVSMVSLRTRRLSPEAVGRARAVLGPLGDIAAKAYADGDERTVMGRMRALGLSEDEARGAAGAFFLTGTETVATLLPRLIALLHDSGALGRVAADLTAPADAAPAPGGAPATGGGLLDRAIDEAMRVATPTPVMLRGVRRPAAVGGVRVRPGDRVVIATHNCCRAYGPFDLDRPPPAEPRRLWFGAGPHFCIGYPLAMAEVRAVARTLLAAGPLEITRRSAARGVLIPAYARLDVRVAGRGTERGTP
ncbi:cytochrome P450 [Actinomadura sp. J1-007]|uniref:cytochrome P450 n=1 Tax=Actinomadura sp. J1-007 TaxID=2661913 RepID=UPI002815F1C8|nr:cytochrome P450 [Actinomadura sp. J1-007]